MQVLAGLQLHSADGTSVYAHCSQRAYASIHDYSIIFQNRGLKELAGRPLISCAPCSKVPNFANETLPVLKLRYTSSLSCRDWQ